MTRNLSSLPVSPDQLGQPLSPIIRFPMGVHDRQHEDFRMTLGVDEAVGKPGQTVAPGTRAN
jgi:hypothetical protein